MRQANSEKNYHGSYYNLGRKVQTDKKYLQKVYVFLLQTNLG